MMGWVGAPWQPMEISHRSRVQPRAPLPVRIPMRRYVGPPQPARNERGEDRGEGSVGEVRRRTGGSRDRRGSFLCYLRFLLFQSRRVLRGQFRHRVQLRPRHETGDTRHETRGSRIEDRTDLLSPALLLRPSGREGDDPEAPSHAPLRPPPVAADGNRPSDSSPACSGRVESLFKIECLRHATPLL